MQHRIRNKALGVSLVTFSAALLLLGCSNSNDDGYDQVCKTITQSLVSATANTGSTLANSDRAFDSDISSFATLTPAAVNGGGTLRGAGTETRSSGTIAGIAYSRPNQGNYTFTITTFLGGTQQESVQVGSESYGTTPTQTCATNGVCLNNANGQSFYGLATSKAFDSIQAAVSVTGTSSAMQIRELCVR